MQQTDSKTDDSIPPISAVIPSPDLMDEPKMGVVTTEQASLLG